MLEVSFVNGAEIEAKEKMNGFAPSKVQTEDFRVKQGPRRAKGQTALLIAVENGRLGATLALLSRGALISATDRFGKNALQTAVTSTKIFDERLSIIHNQGSDSWLSAAAQIPDNITPSQLSPSEKDYRNKLSRVVALGDRPSMNVLTEPFLEFEAALHEDNDQEQIINQLLDSGANITVRTQQNQTLLHLAVSSYPRLFLLLNRAAGLLTIDSCDNTGRTALHYAAAAGNGLAFDLLLAYGADVMARDPKGATALHLGVLSAYSVRAALKHSVGANATDNLGRTPMHYLLMLHKWSKHDFKTYRTPIRNIIILSEYAGENAVRFLEKAGARNLQDARGLRPMDYIEAPFAAQIEMRETARWISGNEERYRLSRDVVAYHFNNLKVSDAELGQSKMDEVFGEEPKWRIVPDEVSASPSEFD